MASRCFGALWAWARTGAVLAAASTLCACAALRAPMTPTSEFSVQGSAPAVWKAPTSADGAQRAGGLDYSDAAQIEQIDMRAAVRRAQAQSAPLPVMRTAAAVAPPVRPAASPADHAPVTFVSVRRVGPQVPAYSRRRDGRRGKTVFAVQIASVANATAARAEWRRVLRRADAVVRRHTIFFEDGASRHGPRVRLVLASFRNKASAAAVCESLKSHRLTCLVTRRTARL